MADAVIQKIENLTKVEALLMLLISAIAGAIWTKFQDNLPIDFLMVVVMTIFVIMVVIFQLLYYLKFIIEKMEWRKDQECLSNVANKDMELGLRKMELEKDILVLQLQMQGVNTTDV